MKKFLQVSVVLLLVLALTVTALSLMGTNSQLAGGSYCRDRVGWNERGSSCYTSAPQLIAQGFAFEFKPGGPQPLVGWNS